MFRPMKGCRGGDICAILNVVTLGGTISSMVEQPPLARVSNQCSVVFWYVQIDALLCTVYRRYGVNVWKDLGVSG